MTSLSKEELQKEDRPFECPVCSTQVSIYVRPYKRRIHVELYCGKCEKRFGADLFSWNFRIKENKS